MHKVVAVDVGLQKKIDKILRHIYKHLMNAFSSSVGRDKTSLSAQLDKAFPDLSKAFHSNDENNFDQIHLSLTPAFPLRLSQLCSFVGHVTAIHASLLKEASTASKLSSQRLFPLKLSALIKD